jgi:hypothetical protein
MAAAWRAAGTAAEGWVPAVAGGAEVRLHGASSTGCRAGLSPGRGAYGRHGAPPATGASGPPSSAAPRRPASPREQVALPEPAAEREQRRPLRLGLDALGDREHAERVA